MAQIFVWYVHWYVRRTWDSVWHIVGIWQTFVEWKNTCKHAWKTRNNCFCLFCLLLQDHLTSINNSTIIHVQECSTLFTYIYDLIWEKAMAPHSSTVARKIPWMEEPGRLQSMGVAGSQTRLSDLFSLSTFMHGRSKWQPTPVFLPGESHGRRSLVGCSPWGHTESDTT